MRWPSKRASLECLCFLCLCLLESAESQCFLFSLCFCGVVRAESLSPFWWELGVFEVLTVGVNLSQSVLFCPARCVLGDIFGSIFTPCELVLSLSVGMAGLPWEFLLQGEAFPSLNTEMFVEECLLSANISFWLAVDFLNEWLLWFPVFDGFGLPGFLGALTSEPVPVMKIRTTNVIFFLILFLQKM